MDWKRIAPWNWFKHEDESRLPTRSRRRGEDVPEFMSSLQTEFDRLFETATRRFFDGMPSLTHLETMDPIRPHVDISEGRKAYTVRAELPGVDREDVSVEADGQRLVIRAEKRREKEDDEEGYHCIERAYGAVQRVLSLPEDADAEGIEARFKNGVLKLRIPKHDASLAQGRRIEIAGS